MLHFPKEEGFQAFRILQFTFVVAPIVAGLDKFFNLLTYWPNYLSPFASNFLNQHNQEFMMAAGVVEILAGIGVALKPKIFSYIVFLWLLGIIANLLLAGQFFDIALRDLGLALSALALARLSRKYA
jgi:hypothetical protein